MPAAPPCETKTLVYVNQPYIALKEAGVLREVIDDHLRGESLQWTTFVFSAWLDGAVNSLLTGGWSLWT